MFCDGKGRPRLLHLSEGQANDHKTAAAVIEDLPAANALLADRAHSSAAFRQALVERGITPCIPPHAKHRVQHRYDPVLYRQRHRIENMFARLRDLHARPTHPRRLQRGLRLATAANVAQPIRDNNQSTRFGIVAWVLFRAS
ncbi:transposase [Mesorhizobium sp. 43Arga]